MSFLKSKISIYGKVLIFMVIVITVFLAVLYFVYKDPLYDFYGNTEAELSAFLEESDGYEVYTPYDMEKFSDFFDKRPE